MLDLQTAPNLNLIGNLPAFISVGAGQIRLRDEGTRVEWDVELRPFHLATVPVTEQLWGLVVGTQSPTEADLGDGVGRGSLRDARPRVNVSWCDAVRFCNQLSEAAGYEPCYRIRGEEDDVDVEPTANGFRLPTEAEWEFACRAGSTGPRYGELDAIGWYAANAADTIHDVMQKAPNAWGLYDMIGNTWEWCWDLYDGTHYGRYRVFRGGGWSDPPRGCRASCRRKSHPTFRIDDLGFRLARTAR